MTNFKIYAALHAEAKEGWIWLPRDAALAGDHVRIRNPRNGLSIVCEGRTADENFIDLYNSTKGTIHLSEGSQFIVMSAWCRQKLGIFDTKTEQPLDVKNAAGWLAAYRSFRSHPSPAIRASILLGAISLALGIVGFVEGTLSLLMR
jgi:hypothetical protein